MKEFSVETIRAAFLLDHAVPDFQPWNLPGQIWKIWECKGIKWKELFERLEVNSGNALYDRAWLTRGQQQVLWSSPQTTFASCGAHFFRWCPHHEKFIPWLCFWWTTFRRWGLNLTTPQVCPSPHLCYQCVDWGMRGGWSHPSNQRAAGTWHFTKVTVRLGFRKGNPNDS